MVYQITNVCQNYEHIYLKANNPISEIFILQKYLHVQVQGYSNAYQRKTLGITQIAIHRKLVT